MRMTIALMHPNREPEVVAQAEAASIEEATRNLKMVSATGESDLDSPVYRFGPAELNNGHSFLFEPLEGPGEVDNFGDVPKVFCPRDLARAIMRHKVPHLRIVT